MQNEIIDPSNSGSGRRVVAAQASGWRLFFKTVIKSGILLGRNLKGMAGDVYSGASGVVAEAKAELDREQKAKVAEPGGAN